MIATNSDLEERGVRVTGAIGRVFLNDTGTVSDSWLVGAGDFPPSASGDGESRVRVESEAVWRDRPAKTERGNRGS
jgi:hypothetical protein